jgi:hypothetical protein
MIESRWMRWAAHGYMGIENKTLVGKPEGKRPLGKPRNRWEDNIRINLKEIMFDSVDWIHLAQDRDRYRLL